MKSHDYEANTTGNILQKRNLNDRHKMKIKGRNYSKRKSVSEEHSSVYVVVILQIEK